MRLTLALLVLVALIAVATDAQSSQKRTNARTLATSTSRLTRNRINARAGIAGRRATSSRRSVIIIGNGSSSSSSSSSTQSSRCRTTTTSCSSNSNVCGRWSSTRRCRRFRNRCLLERANCRTTVSNWNVVSLGNCSSITVNNTGTCTSTFSSTSSRSSRVTPILIRRG
ncbi:vitellogenin-1 [Drosophila sechellia]|nr:vitellogenin-1 [Drosophila sechellia]